MIIGFDAKRAFNNTSGLGNYSRNTIRLLAEYYPRNSYLLYTPHMKGSPGFSSPSGSRIKQPGSYLGQQCSTCWRTFVLGRRLEKDGVDLYHGLSHDLPLGMSGPAVKKVVTIHDMIAYKHPELFTFANRIIYRKKIAHSCRVADKIIAISRQTKEDILDFLDIDPGKIEIVYQTCDPVFFIKSDEEHKKRVIEKYGLPSEFILSVGTIEPRKNLCSVIRAMHKGNIQKSLVVTGKKTNYFNTVLKTLKSLGVQNVHFLEDVPVEDLAAIYQLAEVFVYPSLYEGFGIPVLEALSSGTPVITSSGSCFGETGGPDSLYIDPLDNEQLAIAITRVLSDSNLRKKMIDGGLRHAKNFQSQRIAENMMAVYESTLKNC